MRKKYFILISLLMTISIIASCSTGTTGNIDDVLKKAKKEGKVVMLEIGSVGCVPCDMMKPVMEKLSNQYRGKIEVVFIDIKFDRKAVSRFGVYMIPTQVFLDKNGKEFYRHIGYLTYEEIVPVLKKAGI